MFVIQRPGMRVDSFPVIATGLILLLLAAPMLLILFLTCRVPMRPDKRVARPGV